VLGRTYPDEVLSRVLYATQFTRSLDAHGYVRFKKWRFTGCDGLAGEQVSVWTYEGTLKIEYQATALSEYALHLSPDHQRIEAVKNPRRIETHFLEGAASLVADLRHQVAARIAQTRTGTASFAVQARGAGAATPAPRRERNRLVRRCSSMGGTCSAPEMGQMTLFSHRCSRVCSHQNEWFSPVFFLLRRMKWLYTPVLIIAACHLATLSYLCCS
jgi:hypothetical protein